MAATSWAERLRSWRAPAVAAIALLVGVLGGVAWQEGRSGSPAPRPRLAAAGNFAYPVGPAQVNGIPAGSYPNLAFDAGPLAPLNAVVTIGPDAGDGGAVTYAVLAADRHAKLDTSAGLVATAVLGNASARGECHTLRWWSWADGGSLAQPVITSDAGMVPFAGQSAPGSAGLVTSTSISTPGAAFTLCADGTEWVTP